MFLLREIINYNVLTRMSEIRGAWVDQWYACMHVCMTNNARVVKDRTTKYYSWAIVISKLWMSRSRIHIFQPCFSLISYIYSWTWKIAAVLLFWQDKYSSVLRMSTHTHTHVCPSSMNLISTHTLPSSLHSILSQLIKVS